MIWNGAPVAIGMAAGEMRLLVARANGSLRPKAQFHATIDADLLRPGLRAPNVSDPHAASAALRRLAEEAGVLGRPPELVALVVPDAAVRLAVVPVEGDAPKAAQGDGMARWALRDLLPIGADEARIDWAVLEASGGARPSLWLLAIGAERIVVREYETLIESLGWTVGRVVPWSLALAVGVESLDSAMAAGDEATDAGEQGAALGDSEEASVRDREEQAALRAGGEAAASALPAGSEPAAGPLPERGEATETREANVGRAPAAGESRPLGAGDAAPASGESRRPAPQSATPASSGRPLAAEGVAAGDASLTPGGARLLVCESGGRLACLVEAGGVPRLHRAWRRPVSAHEISQELPPLDQYVRERLDVAIGEVVVSGSAPSVEAVRATGGGLGWRVRAVDPWSVLLGALVR